MYKRLRFLIPAVVILALVGVGAWYLTQGRAGNESGALRGSGTVEAVQVLVAPETAGRIAEVYVRQGERVEIGAPLFRLEDDLLQVQIRQANAALEAAQAALEVAQTGLQAAQDGESLARLQSELELTAARAQDQPARRTAWNQALPSEFSLPVWYFDKDLEIASAEIEVNVAYEALEAERAEVELALASNDNAAFQESEESLAQAQATYLNAQDLLARAQASADEALRDAAQAFFDRAQSDLEAAQVEYDRLLPSPSAVDVRAARARLAVAQERYQAALDRLSQLQTGENAPRVKIAEAALRQAGSNVLQAQARVEQAQKGILQAQAQIDLLEIQLIKLVVHSSVAGVVLTRSIEPGEVVLPGSAALAISRLDDLTITVFLPEDRYGQVDSGMRATVAVDSFPGATFEARVVRIADRAEFTPRNVQTQEGRRTTVFAIELSVLDATGRLKPGMPADVTFETR